jgi:hypothetical protein
MFILLYVDDISMLYLRTEAGTKAAIEVKAKLWQKCKITDLGPARQFLDIDIHHDSTSTSHGWKAVINAIVT